MSSRTGPSNVAEQVVISLQSTATANISTFEQLQALLGCKPVLPVREISVKPKNPAGKDRSRKQEPRTVEKKNIRNVKSVNPPPFTIHESLDCEIQPLPLRSRQKLATEAFNSSLKCLSANAKTRQQSVRNANGDQSSSSDRLPKPGPLQPYPPNTQPVTTVRSCSQQNDNENVGIIADCAITALDCLRQLSSDDKQNDDLDIQRLEKGALVLLDKLITLELPQHAMREASKIYEQYWKRRKDDDQSKKTDQSSVTPLPIAFDQKPPLGQDFTFVSSYQSHMLRLAILLGAEAVSLTFVSTMGLKNTGSPADVVLQGAKNRQLESEKAGQQLRTISQALLKLYSICCSNVQHRKKCSELNFRLLIEGLQIKCESWLLLKHEPKLSRDMWPHVLKGLRRLEVDGGNDILNGFAVALSSMQSVTLLVQAKGYKPGIPFDIVAALTDMSEKAGRYADGLMLLQQLEDHDDGMSSQQRMALHWRTVIFQQRVSGVCDTDLPRMLDSALTSTKAVQVSSPDDIDSIVLHGARLRKTLITIITAMNQQIIEPSVVRTRILTSCLSILSEIAQLFWKISCSDEATGDHRRLTHCVTGFAKIFESVIEISEKYALQATTCRELYDSALEVCVSSAKNIILDDDFDPDLKAIFASLLTRTSHLYWLRYANYKLDDPSEHNTIQLLELSCAPLVSLSMEVQKAASYGIKLEKLALAHLAKKHVERSCKCFEDAIGYYIRLGALEESAEAALSGPSRNVWSRSGSLSCSLGKSVSSLARLRLTHGLDHASSDSWIFDDVEAKPIGRCLLFEAQAAIVMEHQLSLSQAEAFTRKVEEMINLVTEPELQVYRLRCLSQILRVIAKNNSFSSITLSTWTIVRGLFEKRPCSTSGSALSSYAESTFLITELQYLVHDGFTDISALKACTQALSSLILSLPDVSALNGSIDDLKFVLNQLQAVSDLAHTLDDIDLVRPVLLCTQHALSLAAPDNFSQRADILTQLAVLFHRSGDGLRARRLYEEAAHLLKNISKDTIVYSRWSLSFIKYLIDISETEKVMDLYGSLTIVHGDVQSPENYSSNNRLQHEYLLSMAAQTASRIAFHHGDLPSYARLARQSIELSTRIWQFVEKSYGSVNKEAASRNDDSINELSKDLTALTIAPKFHALRSRPKGSAYWPYIDLHCSALYQIINVSIHDGLYKDARCYADQLVKVARIVGSSTRQTRALSMSAFIYAKANYDAKAAEILQDRQPLSKTTSVEEDQYSQIWQAEAFVELGQLGKAKTVIYDLQSVLDHKKPEKVIDQEAAGLQKPPVRGRAKVTRPIKANPKRAASSAVKAPKAVNMAAEANLSYSQRFIRQKTQALTTLISLAESETSSPAPSMPDLQILGRNSPEAAVIRAIAMLQQAFIQLSSDAVRCVLDEAAVALPVRYRSSRKSGRVSFVQADARIDATIRGKGRPREITSTALATKTQLSSGEELVVSAQKLLDGIYCDFQQSCTTELLHVLCKLQSKIALLSSTLNAPFAMSTSELVLRSLSPKDVVQSREYAIIEAERATRQKAQMLTWPASTGHQEHRSLHAPVDYSLDDIADMPETWNVVTISLADNQKELLLSRITAGRSPFLLRVPLSRSDFDLDNEEFTFADAKSELLEIVAEANASAHDTRGQGEREARKAWYADREVLDKRLETWLSNIENIWLGGFRGLMSSDDMEEEVLTKFGLLLNKILDKHLPSRQKSGASKTGKIVLHAHVLELFLGLGHPDEQEIDDATTDLLYFVIDILQFSGEQNAYDEIDFDAMLVDVFDAMRSSHYLQLHKTSAAKHTILIVDKEMASFPWESLPCLRTQSVSRMPSLSSVFQRLKKIRQQCSTAQGYRITAERGATILNPSSDLLSTQKTFQPIIKAQLPTFNSIVNHRPSESEFTSLLTGNELLLYFGHGSGAQYVRGRAIRNLDSCAVTLLMGCSSAQMTECGKFESYGMPGYYIGGMSGCMAVVGTLWDVTDRDIDRFALKTMVEWGLIEEDDMVTKALEKSNKKSVRHSQDKKICSVQERRGVVSLDEAVSKARSACLLRYLNGAAPVVYGVPVFLQ